MSDIIVIGGGAAGMMAAVAAAENGGKVTLLEKNEKVGKKLYITGKGRCNLTNACETEALFDSFLTNSKFLYSAVYSFDNHACMDYFESIDVALKTERGNRVFPESDHSSEVIRALWIRMRNLGVKFNLYTQAERLLIEEDRIRGVFDTKGRIYFADAVILATGGVSYPLTGSTGDGYRMAEESGHRVNTLYPILVPLYAEEERWCRMLMGLSLKNVSVKLKKGRKVFYEGFGEMLFTHFGVSGPLILSASCYVTELLAEREKEERILKEVARGERELDLEMLEKGQKMRELELLIDLKPALSKEQLDQRLLREFAANKNKLFRNGLDDLFPSRLIPVMIELSGIDGDKRISEITGDERAHFLQCIKEMKLTIKKTSGIEEAIVTRGGVNVKDINPSTMESRRVKGLYFAGELIDVDALTGGYNLQIAWSTGHLAGTCAAQAAEGKRKRKK